MVSCAAMSALTRESQLTFVLRTTYFEALLCRHVSNVWKPIRIAQPSMDQIHDVEKKPWIFRSKFKIKDLAVQRSKLLQEHDIKLSGSGISTINQESEDLAKKLEAFVNDDEERLRPHFLFNSTDERVLVNEPNCKLDMYKLQLEHSKRMISDRAYKVEYLSRLKTKRKDILMRHMALADRLDNTEGTSWQQELACEPHRDSLIVILVVQIWPQPKKNEKLKMKKEMLFRADQCLTDLRDQLRCQRDYGVPMDLSDNPEHHDERVFRGELFKSGFFLIENTFYNDMRDVNNTDLSARIVDWAGSDVNVVDEENRNVKVSRGIRPLQRARMEQTKFEDLTLRLGYPYLYLHQGNCEHLFTISDIRYMQDGPRLRQLQFPFVTAAAFDRKEDSLKCYMCQNRPPHWYTRNNDRLPVDPYFFCQNCFMSFNYDDDKKKIGRFQAFLYTCTFGIPDSIVTCDSRQVETST